MGPHGDRGIDLVVKVGGAAGITHNGLAGDIARLRSEGIRLVVVHGGSSEASALGERLGVPPRFITSPSGQVSRRTDRETMEILMMACAGKVGKTLVECLQLHGVNAVGLTGIDGRLLVGSRKTAIRSLEDGKVKVIKDDLSGRMEQVNTNLLLLLVNNGYVPVVGPIALSHEGEPLNVDADRVASALALALEARKLVILSNVPGLLRDMGDESTLIRRIARAQVAEYATFAVGRMKKKILAAAEAVGGGVMEVVLGDARPPEPLMMAMNGGGTVIR